MRDCIEILGCLLRNERCVKRCEGMRIVNVGFGGYTAKNGMLVGGTKGYGHQVRRCQKNDGNLGADYAKNKNRVATCSSSLDSYASSSSKIQSPHNLRTCPLYNLLFFDMLYPDCVKNGKETAAITKRHLEMAEMLIPVLELCDHSDSLLFAVARSGGVNNQNFNENPTRSARILDSLVFLPPSPPSRSAAEAIARTDSNSSVRVSEQLQSRRVRYTKRTLWTALRHAIQNGALENVRILLKALTKSSASCYESSGSSDDCSQSDGVDMVNHLADEKGYIEVTVSQDEKEKEEETGAASRALSTAIQSRQPAIVTLLLNTWTHLQPTEQDIQECIRNRDSDSLKTTLERCLVGFGGSGAGGLARLRKVVHAAVKTGSTDIVGVLRRVLERTNEDEDGRSVTTITATSPVTSCRRFRIDNSTREFGLSFHVEEIESFIKECCEVVHI
jgi:hypothetical protein